MHPMGCMAALNRDGFRALALNLTWFRAQSAFESVSPAPYAGVVKAIILVVEQLFMERLFPG
jgi:hypothetical protein